MADVTRLEQFLNHIAHPEDPVPTPQTRLEHNLKEIADNKGGGGGGSGVLYVTITALPDPETGDTSITSDKTYAEIDAAITAGTPVIGRLASEGFFAPMSPAKLQDGTIAFLMIGFSPMGQSAMLLAATIEISTDDTVAMSNMSSASLTPIGG